VRSTHSCTSTPASSRASVRGTCVIVAVNTARTLSRRTTIPSTVTKLAELTLSINRRRRCSLASHVVNCTARSLRLDLRRAWLARLRADQLGRRP
jgi:hypothetical protein